MEAAQNEETELLLTINICTSVFENNSKVHQNFNDIIFLMSS